MTVPVLEVRAAHKRFGAVHALKGVGLKAWRGEVLALLGDNGAGKSTLIKCISGVHGLDEGDILLDGESVLRDNPDALRQRIGMVFQNFNLFPHRTVLDNVTLAPMLTKGVRRPEAERRAL